jgi:hypothetical protein
MGTGSEDGRKGGREEGRKGGREEAAIFQSLAACHGQNLFGSP